MLFYCKVFRHQHLDAAGAGAHAQAAAGEVKAKGIFHLKPHRHRAAGDDAGHQAALQHLRFALFAQHAGGQQFGLARQGFFSSGQVAGVGGVAQQVVAARLQH